MLTVAWVLLVITWVILIWVSLVFRSVRKENTKDRDADKVRFNTEVKDNKDYLRSLLDASRNGSIRYEIAFTDWGQDYGDMRYRWTVWDADRLIVTEVEPETVLGISVPFMLGNALIKHIAEQEAMEWVDRQTVIHPYRRVVVARDENNDMDH